MVRVLFIGSGAVHFGGAEGPWDHSRRLEAMEDVQVVAIADPDVKRAASVLERKLNGPHSAMYADCKLYASYLDAIEAAKPDVAFIGVPPFCHGDLTPPLDIELKCLEKGVHIFIEKPISVQVPEALSKYLEALENARREKGLLVSVGYMFRYHPAVEKIQQILKEQGVKTLCINARYNCAYSELDHPFWWDARKSGGPIVEQGTHFCDLMRWLGGEVKMRTLAAVTVPASDTPGAAGYLSKVPAVVKEGAVPLEYRPPRVTTCHWVFEDGGVGTLTHGVALQGKRYEAHVDVWADGLRIRLEDIYFPECKLHVRTGESDQETVYSFPDADPYMGEIRTFLDAVKSKDGSAIRSPYSDALRTYELSWAVRRAGDKSLADNN